jgi:hypothetical protein
MLLNDIIYVGIELIGVLEQSNVSSSVNRAGGPVGDFIMLPDGAPVQLPGCVYRRHHLISFQAVL